MAELIFEEAPFPSCHASTIAERGDGALVASWFGGTRERAPDVGIWTSTRSPDGWSAPELAASHDDTPCWNPVLHPARSGDLLLFYKAGPSPQSWSGLLKRSSDGGVTWSRTEMLPAGILGPVKNKPFERSDGALVCGTSVESWRNWGCWVEITPDEGRTWTRHGPVNVAGHGSIQPAVFGEASGELAMVCRAARLGRVVRGTSHDGGRTWSALEPVDLPHNNSGLDAVRIRDGRVVLVYNHTTSGRTPLNVAVSRDMGLTWTEGPVLESAEGEYSYPAVIEGADGAVHVTYTWRRQRIAHVRLDPSELPDA